MKKLTTLLALAALIAGANALHAQVRIHVGAAQQNIPTSTTILNHTIHDTVSRLGFYGGLSYTIDLNHHFELTLGANANYFYEHDTVNILGMAGVTSNFTEVDLSIPIHLGYAIHFGDKIRNLRRSHSEFWTCQPHPISRHIHGCLKRLDYRLV